VKIHKTDLINSIGLQRNFKLQQVKLFQDL